MYIQPFGKQIEKGEVTLPAGYSGNAFAPHVSSPHQNREPQEKQDAPNFSFAEPTPVNIPENGAENPVLSSDISTDASPIASAAEEEPAVPASASPRPSGLGGLLGGGVSDLLRHFPALTKFLPPERGGKSPSGDLTDWLIPGILILMMQKSDEEDILPFLLALLLW